MSMSMSLSDRAPAPAPALLRGVTDALAPAAEARRAALADLVDGRRASEGLDAEWELAIELATD